MFQVFKGSISGANEISGQIFEMSSFRYQINPDFRFEIPSMTFSTTIATLAYDDSIIVRNADDTDQQVKFYVRTVTYDYERRLYVAECEHVFGRLRRIKARSIQTPLAGTLGNPDFDDEWCDVDPGPDCWAVYNRQIFDYATGDVAWSRQYFQVIFLMKILIHRADGVSVDDIRDQLGSKTSFYGSPALGYRTYDKIGVAGQSLIRMGMKHYLDIISTDYDVEQGLVTCFDVLRELCALLMCQVDIFRADYTIDVVDIQADIAEDATIQGREDSDFEPYRNYSVKQSLLNFTDSYERDFQFGAVDSGGQMQLYTWGEDVTSPERTVVDRKYSDIADDALLPKNLDVVYLKFLRPYEIIIAGSNGYRSHISVIRNAGGTLSENYMYLAGLMAKWSGIRSKSDVSMTSPGIVMKGMATEIDVAARPSILRYERYGT